ncbi:MAG TPA: hypothetical protein VK633_04620 [Verrucomicrobiae bacterium]|nr:hypothetical protein [Verrucomicrobiae bacterium]
MNEPLQITLKRGVKKWLRRQNWNVRRASRTLHVEQRIQRTNKLALSNFKRLSGRSGMKVHLGCGPDVRAGWINIDLNTARSAKPFEESADGTVYINYDLRLGLPLENASCGLVYSSHFFEHLEYECGVKLMEDCSRALQLGGKFRIVLPDMKSLFQAYLKKDAEFFKLLDPLLAPEIEPATATLIDYINYGVYQFGEHKYIYDEEKLIKVLGSVGFSQVGASSFQPEVDVNTPTRKKYSFYVEAAK